MNDKLQEAEESNEELQEAGAMTIISMMINDSHSTCFLVCSLSSSASCSLSFTKANDNLQRAEKL